MGEYMLQVQSFKKAVAVRDLGEKVALIIEPDGTVVFDTDFFDALVQRIVVRVGELEVERLRSRRPSATPRGNNVSAR